VQGRKDPDQYRPGFQEIRLDWDT